jgi:hypothetical protein
VTWRISAICTKLCGKIEYFGSWKKVAYLAFYLLQLCLDCSAFRKFRKSGWI